MKCVMVQYKVKADRAKENVQLVQQVYEELKANSPEGIRYVTFQQEDGVSFVHIAIIADGNNNPLHQTATFKAFQANIADRCEIPPHAVEITQVGAFGFPAYELES